METECVVCARPFRKVASRTLTRCPDCIAAGRGRCPCGVEVSVAPRTSGRALCETCRAQSWRRYDEPKQQKHVATCIVCDQAFPVFASRRTSQRRCPSCVAAARARCPVCYRVFAATPTRDALGVLGFGSRPRCPDCQQPQAGPRGGRVVRWGDGKDRSPRLTLACRGVELYDTTRWAKRCWGERVYTPSYAGRMHTYRPEDATYVCRPCIGQQRVYGDLAQQIARDPERFSKDPEFSDRVIDIVDDGSRVRSLRQAGELLAAWGSTHPPRARGVPPRETKLGARVALPVPAGWRGSAAKWRKGVRWQVRQCQTCGLLLMSWPAPKSPPTTTHRHCMVEGMRTPEVRQWLAERRRRRDRGESTITINRAVGFTMPLPKAKGRQSDPATLTRQLQWAILHFLGGDTLGAIARQFGVTRQTVHGAVRRILLLLPDGDVEYAPFRKLVYNLREAAGSLTPEDARSKPVSERDGPRTPDTERPSERQEQVERLDNREVGSRLPHPKRRRKSAKRTSGQVAFPSDLFGNDITETAEPGTDTLRVRTSPPALDEGTSGK